MSRARQTHRILGIVLLLPICAWAVTGFVFFIKPGYRDAYSPLHVREYDLAAGEMTLRLQPGWLEMRAVRTILGDHLFVRTAEGWAHLDPATSRPRELPDQTAIRRLLEDCVVSRKARYGQVTSVVRHAGAEPSASITTSTGVEIELDWTTLALSQSGRDTRLIDTLYRIHYLQWTGVRVLDRMLGVIGLASLVILAALGLRLALPRRGPMAPS